MSEQKEILVHDFLLPGDLFIQNEKYQPQFWLVVNVSVRIIKTVNTSSWKEQIWNTHGGSELYVWFLSDERVFRAGKQIWPVV